MVWGVLGLDGARAEDRDLRRTPVVTDGRPLGQSDAVAGALDNGIAGSELVVFDHLSHAGLHEDPETFNRATLDFLLRQRA